MKKIAIILLGTVCMNMQLPAQSIGAHGYPISPVPFTSVKVTDAFWGRRLEASREVTIPLAFRKCEESGRYENFVKAARPSDSYKVEGYSFDDTDVYKTIEGASYLLQTYPDKKLEHYMDSVLALVAAAQEPDGYLYTARTMNPKHPHAWAGSRRWEKVEDLSHEFYNLGHMVEGAIAHYQATGKRTFLDIAMRYADCVCREIGDGPGKQVAVPGHQIAEMALAKLYLVTGDRKYLDEAKFFLDKRGYTSRKGEYSQAHKPVVEQDEAVGHAVRAAYMYSGMADVAALTGDSAYIRAIGRIWDNIVSKKYYITGGIGATSKGEAFGKNYELPNMSAYCETCAAIGNVYLNYRLFLLHGESKYFDVLERTLYNGLISGVSLDGGAFFYPNPLESMGQHQRQPWFGCACCPSNICRFIPSLPGYVYAVKEKSVYVNLFMSNEASLDVKGKKLGLRQTTRYPFEGDTEMEITRATGSDFILKIRIPGWVRNRPVPSDLYRYADGKQPTYAVRVNGMPAEASVQADGYVALSRKWRKGDKVTVHFDMPPRVVKAHPSVTADKGRIAVERGPLVYCAEWKDNDFDVLGVLMNREPQIWEMMLDGWGASSSVTDRKDSSALNSRNVSSAETGRNASWAAAGRNTSSVPADRTDALLGALRLQTPAQALKYDVKGRLVAEDITLTLIPYYAWAHRGAGAMSVWLPAELNACRPSQPETLASRSRLTASHPTAALTAVNDRLVPQQADDRSLPYYHWWPKQGSTEWLVYTFPEATAVSHSAVYWFDDAPWGGCRVPASWRLYYKDASGAWQPVTVSGGYGVEKGVANEVNFVPVTTTALKLEVRQPEKYSCGLFEWKVK